MAASRQSPMMTAQMAAIMGRSAIGTVNWRSLRTISMAGKTPAITAATA